MQIRTLAPLALSLATIFPGLFVNAASVSHTGLQSSSARAAAGSKYTKAHSLGDSYKFDPRDGWRTLNASDAQYKYRRDKAPALKANDKSKAVGPLKTISDGVQVLSGIWKGLKGIGSPSSVTITWYTGHDLLNPSCWAKTDWAPTDQSFVCAVTMEGWTDKPQCFKFIESMSIRQESSAHSSCVQYAINHKNASLFASSILAQAVARVLNILTLREGDLQNLPILTQVFLLSLGGKPLAQMIGAKISGDPKAERHTPSTT
ncbi:unnamed protein product [Mycena citricolor]|uniref:Uncharacterized protein n=1 Tax=Mycena citricolor TaxID=2018698 RepID=A0AAD2JVI7_9AGAR|nr:unnamed protein product [Mycena citricolor]